MSFAKPAFSLAPAANSTKRMAISASISPITNQTTRDTGFYRLLPGKPGDPQLPAAERLAQDCEAAGLRVLLDDRVGVSPGIKFNDAELIGVPTIIIVGRGLADGVVEVKDRRTGERHDVTIDKAVSELRTANR